MFVFFFSKRLKNCCPVFDLCRNNVTAVNVAVFQKEVDGLMRNPSICFYFWFPFFCSSMAKKKKKFTLSAHHRQWRVREWSDGGTNPEGGGAILLFWPIFPENIMNMKRIGLLVRFELSTYWWSKTIHHNHYSKEPTVSWRHRKVLNSLHSRLTGSS